MAEVKLKTTSVVILIATAVLVSIVVLVASNFYFLNNTNKNLADIDNAYNQKLDIMSRMTHIVRERSLLMLAMYVEDDEWLVDEKYMKFHALAGEFMQLRERLEAIGLTPEEQDDLNKALTLIRTTEPMQNRIVENIRTGLREGIRTEISERDLPLESQLLDIFNNLTNNARHIATNTRHQARQIYKHSMYTVAFVSLAISLIVIALLYRFMRKIQVIEMDLIEESASLSWDATHDPLTNIHNRRWLEHKIEQLGKRESDRHSINAIIYMDLDDFKAINDHYGHKAGDKYLIGFCREVEHCIRQHDIFARIGGDEFVILLDNCDLENGKEIATNILHRIQKFNIKFEGDNLSAHCSIGLLEFRISGDSLKDIIHQADAYCYEAKRMGKNMIYSGLQSVNTISSIRN